MSLLQTPKYRKPMTMKSNPTRQGAEDDVQSPIEETISEETISEDHQSEENKDKNQVDNREAYMAALAAKLHPAAEPEDEASPPAHNERHLDNKAPEAPETPVYKGSDGKYYTTVKVDGKEEEVTFDQVKANYQKSAHVDASLREAAYRRSQLEQDIAAFNNQKNNQSLPGKDENKSALPDKGEQKASIATVIKKLKESTLYDDEDAEVAATEELAKLFENNFASQTPQQATINPTQIVEQVSQELQRKNSVDKVRVDPTYAPLFQDTYALKEMNDHSAQIRSENPDLSIEENLKMAGDRVFERARKMAGTNTNSFDSRVNAKRAMTPAITVASTAQRSVAAQAAPAAQSNRDIIAEMRQQRRGR